MDGLEFERYVMDLLRRHGFERVSLTKKYDLGIDIVAEKDNERAVSKSNDTSNQWDLRLSGRRSLL
jgi:HJR/Mrr/RecB family endonuclease